MVRKILVLVLLIHSSLVSAACSVAQLDADGNNIYVEDKKLEYYALISELDTHSTDEAGNSVYFLPTGGTPALPQATFGNGYIIDLNPYKPQFEVIGGVLVFISAYIAFFKIIG